MGLLGISTPVLSLAEPLTWTTPEFHIYGSGHEGVAVLLTGFCYHNMNLAVWFPIG